MIMSHFSSFYQINIWFSYGWQFLVWSLSMMFGGMDGVYYMRVYLIESYMCGVGLPCALGVGVWMFYVWDVA